MDLDGPTTYQFEVDLGGSENLGDAFERANQVNRRSSNMVLRNLPSAAASATNCSKVSTLF